MLKLLKQPDSEIKERFPELNIGLVHGKMKADEKQAVMQQFKANELQLLIATTVIEVGVDVPNASIMVIENAERLGLSNYTNYVAVLVEAPRLAFAPCYIKAHCLKMDKNAYASCVKPMMAF